MAELSIREAAAQGVDRLRKPNWAMPEDHLKLDIINGEPGPWTQLYSPFNLKCNGRDPVDLLLAVDYDAREYVPYDGPLPDADEYTANVRQFMSRLDEPTPLQE